ncbi:MAG: YceI family protein [Thiomicrorhabdus chilensis]|uniref:YceI family protein n=1 Tax=Thiomicrorhabdus chilensis TaxID=63656 RepID=UPI00299F0357|nr:YceI family protein [Thiomicrorhabdus chilensis]MDX1346806.1 YceI family protein [Thiomicrorhabdus chilensis]
MNKLQSFGLSLGLSASMLAVSPAVMAAPVEYAIDTPGMHASVNFKIQHLGYSWLTGRFEKFSGDYVYDADTLSNSRISVKIDTASVSTNHAERDKHLRSADFLNVKKFPEAKFVSTAITGGDDSMQVKGQFTLNGVTRDMVIEAHKIGEGKDPWGGYRSGFSGTTSFKLADYKISKDLGPASAEVFLELHIEGVRK